MSKHPPGDPGKPPAKRARKQSIDAADRDLFQQAIGSVRPVRNERADDQRKRPAPRPLQSQRDEQQVLESLLNAPWDPAETELGDELLHRKDGVSPRVLKRLRRGYYSVRDELDLHQMNSESATASIRRFLAECRDNGHQCVKIIHGKGLRSPTGIPVLKQLTGQVLRQRSDVLAFASAPPGDGGTGAVLVLLARRG